MAQSCTCGSFQLVAAQVQIFKASAATVDNLKLLAPKNLSSMLHSANSLVTLLICKDMHRTLPSKCL